MPINFVFAYGHPITQHYRQRRAWKLSLLAPIWIYGKSTRDSACPYDWLVTVKRQKDDYASFSVLSNILQNVLSKMDEEDSNIGMKEIDDLLLSIKCRHKL